MNRKNYISIAKKSAEIQIKELKKIKKVFNNSFVDAVNLIMNCKGKIIFSGVGKNSYICKKAAATFSSTGIPSFFVDPTGVSHGDAGQIEKNLGYREDGVTKAQWKQFIKKALDGSL